MLSLVTVQEIRRLLDEGELSQRKIAAKLEVSRGTINAIASGQRGLHGKVPQRETPLLCCYATPPVRCCGCGGRVYSPCLLCRARKYKARRQNPLAQAIACQPISRLVA